MTEKYYWLNKDSRKFLERGYLIEGETPEQRVRDIAEAAEKYLKIKEKHSIAGVMVSNYWKIREIILRWRYNPNLQCVKNKLKREFESYKI